MGGGDSGGGGGGGGTTTTVQKAELPAYAQPYATQLLERGSSLSSTPYSQYGGQRIAGLNADQTAGADMIRNRAVNGSGDFNAARGELQKTLQGDYLRPETNPYLKGMADTAMNDVQSRVNSQFNRPGAFGGSAHQELLTRGLGEAANSVYGQNYANERTNMQRGLALAPQYQNADYQDAQALLGVGDIYGQRDQQALDLAYQQFVDQQNYPYQQLDVLANALAGSVGGRSTQSGTQMTPTSYNRTANALGYGIGGAALGGLSGVDNGALYGGLLGGGLGLFS